MNKNNLQNIMEINHFGKPYSFTHIAAIQRFGQADKYIPRITIADTIDSVLIGDKDSIAVVPIENTTGGIIHDTVELLCMEESKDLVIYEELELSVKLFLLAKDLIDLSAVKTIYSHEYALKNSVDWIKSHIPQAKIKKVNSTSEAACKALEEEHSCAISSSEAADYYHLKKLKEVQVEGKKNLTRFFILGNKKTSITQSKIGEYRTTLIFELNEGIGVLCDALKIFKENNISLTRIISRPDIKKEWSYIFFIEIKGKEEDPQIKMALSKLKNHTINIRLLGSYPLIKL